MDFTGYRHRETTEPTGARSSPSATSVCSTTGRGVSHLWIFRIENSDVSIPPKSAATKTDIPPPPARRNQVVGDEESSPGAGCLPSDFPPSRRLDSDLTSDP